MSGWDGVNLCHSSLHSALLSICGWISADKAPVSSWRWAAFVKHGGFLSPCQQRVGWGQGRGWEGTRQPWPKRYSTLQDLTFSNMSSKEAEGRMFVMMAFVFSSNHYTCWEPAFQEKAGHMPANGKGRMSALFHAWEQLFFHLLNHLYLDPKVFSLLPSWFSPSFYCG